MEKYLKKIKELKTSHLQSLGGSSKYNKNFINTNYFGDVKNISLNIIKNFEKEINKKIKELKKLKKELLLDKKINPTEKELLEKTINGIIKKFLIIRYSIPLEAEKGGIFLETEKRKTEANKINKLQNQVYGKEISQNKSEVKKIVNFLNSLLEENKENISKSEARTFKNFLDSFFVVKNIKNLKSEIKNLEDIKVIPLDIEKILNLVLELYKLDWNTKISEVGNFSVDYDKKIINIPTKNITLKRLLEIIDHEIGVHIIRWENTLKNTGIAGENYQEIEEGFAVFSEKLISQNLEEIYLNPTIHHITAFFAENLDFENTRKFVEIYFKLISKDEDLKTIKKNAIDRTKRVKSFVSIYEKGANRKDVSYTRGQEKIKKILSKKDNISFLKDFYFSKLSFEDFKYIPYLKEKYNSEIKFPIFVGKIIYEKLKDEKIDLESLRKKDFRFQIIKEFSKFEIEKIEEIFNEIRKLF